MGEAVGKFLGLLVDSLTPRSVRLLLLASVVALGYGWWVHAQQLEEQRKAIVEYRVEMAGLREDLKAMLKTAEDGNTELRAIRNILMTGKP